MKAPNKSRSSFRGSWVAGQCLGAKSTYYVSEEFAKKMKKK